MKSKLTLGLLAAALTTSAVVPETANARRHYVHRGHVRHHRCSGGKGVVGTVAGGVGGAVIANAVVGGPVATVAGAVGGGLLGRHIDKQNVRHRHGC